MHLPRIGQQSHLGNPLQDGSEQLPRHSHLGHLEEGIPRMTHDLRASLDEFLTDTCSNAGKPNVPTPDRKTATPPTVS